MKQRTVRLLVLLVAQLFAFQGVQAFPDRPVKLVVPTPAERAGKRSALDGHRSQTGPLTAAIGYDAFHNWFVDETFRAPTSVDLQWAMADRWVMAS